MPAPFSPVNIPFISGVRQDFGVISQESPTQLRRAENVVFTKKGAITGRPGIQTRDAKVERSLVGGGTVGLIANLATVAAGQTPAGIVSTGFPLSPSGTDTPLVAWQGEGYIKRDLIWASTGQLWSLRQTKSAVLKTYDPAGVPRADPCPVGQNVVAVNTAGAGGSGQPFLNDAGEITSISFATTTGSPGYSEANCAAAGNATFFIDTITGNVFGNFTAGIPLVTVAVIGTGATLVATSQQAMSAVQGPDGFFYVAFTSSTAGRITVVRVDTSGTVTQTLNLNGLGTVQGVSLVHNGNNPGRLGLAWKDTAGPTLKTKILTITAGVMADAVIDFTLTGTPLITFAADFGALAAGITHLGQMSVTFTTSIGDLYIGGRSFTAAAETSRTLLVGNGLVGNLRSWDPMFGAVVVAGHTLLGVYSCFVTFNAQAQWIVLDATKIYNSKTTDRTVAAAGPYLGAARMAPSHAYSTPTSVSFAVAEGLSFSGINGILPQVQRAGIRRITLATQALQAAHVNGVTVLSGQLAHVFDGASTRPDHFVEEMPFINPTASTVTAGGSLAAGSFTYQTTWESINARGQIVRSGASNQVTLASASAGHKALVVTTIPQLSNNSSQLESIRVRLWATQINPTASAPLYFVTETAISVPASGTPVTLVHLTEAVGNEEQLYETTQTLSDMRAPGADRGVAVVNERVWVADQDKLYVSKIIRPNLAPSWNTEGPNVIPLPATLGTIQGLASVNTGLVVMCSRGAAVVTGGGVDDTGAGPGWTLQIIDGVPGMGSSSPRSLTTIPAGVAFQSQDGDIWMANSSGQAIPLSRPLRDSATVAAGVDVVFLTPILGANATLVSHGLNGRLRILDLENGQWGTWVFPTISPTNGLYLASINGVLWVQTALGVFSVDETLGTEVITASIETGNLRQAYPTVHGWGRLRSVVLNEARPFPDTSVAVTMQVVADQNERPLLAKTRNVNPTDPDEFYNGSDGALEFRASSQRCSYFRVLLQITPATFNLQGLDVWVANTGERAPTSNRS
jgi:hypothetical protein